MIFGLVSRSILALWIFFNVLGENDALIQFFYLPLPLFHILFNNKLINITDKYHSDIELFI